MRREERFLLAAYKASLQSRNKFPIGAVLVVGHRIISWGHNRTKSHPKQPSRISFSGRLCTEPHAELDALIRAPYEMIKGSSIYVARRMKNGNVGLSRPCYRCTMLLENYGVKKATYTTGGSIDNLLYEDVNVVDLQPIVEKCGHKKHSQIQEETWELSLSTEH